MSLVSFVKAADNGPHILKKAILDSLDLVHYQFPKDTKNIVVKPNMCYYWDYTTGQTTSPKFVIALIDAIRDRLSSHVKISIVESDATAMRCKHAFKMLGYERIAAEYDVKLVNLSEDKGEIVEVSANGQSFRFLMPQTIQNADLRINVPKIKYMPLTNISCSLKNIFGCNPDPAKVKCHPRLDENIVALNKIMKFSICILDGIIVVGNRTRKLDLVMASRDPVAFDGAAARVAGVNPKSVRHITLANKEGLGNISFIPKGEDPQSFENEYPRKGFLDAAMLSAYKLATRAGLLDAETI